MSLAEVGIQEGIGSERVRQLERKAFIALKKKNEIQEAASFYGYDCQQAYHYGLNRFKNTRTSSTEFVALKRLEIEQRLAAVDEMINWL